VIITTTASKIKAKLATPVVRNIIWLSFDKVFKLVVGLVVGIWVARYLGPAQWGEINYVFAFITIISTIDKLGMDSFLVKEILENPTQKREILGTAFLIRIFLIPFLIGSVVLYFHFLNLGSNAYWLLAFLSFNLITTPFDVIDLDFQSRLQSKLTVLSKNIAYVVGALIRVYLLVYNKPLLWFAASMGFEVFLSYFLLVINYQRKDSMLHWSFSMKLVKKLLTAAWPFTVASLAIILYMRIDQVMLGSMVGEKELGLFSSVVKISDIFIFIPMAISSSYLPLLVATRKDGLENFVKKIQFFMNWMFKISFAPALAVTLFSGIIIQQLYGAEYMAASPILVIHIWSLVPIFLGVASSQYMIIENLQKFGMYRTVIGLIVNVLLNLFLIPKYGAMGAATATTISQFTAALFCNLLFKQTRMLFYMQIKSFWMIFNFKE